MREDKPAFFDLVLRPNRSMPHRHFWLMMAGVALVFLLMGLRFLLLGAWPIIPFMLMDIALLGWAMRASYRSGRASEHIRLDGSGLELVRVAAQGSARRTRIEPLGARVELELLGADQNRLWLTGRGARHAIGAFLSPAERADIARVIEDGLAAFRRGRS
ncbi:MAG: DUF2244 domain-containing protein [Sandaracinobacteroides sp.]